MPLGTIVGLSPGDIVLDGKPAPNGKEHSSPKYGFVLQLTDAGRAACVRKPQRMSIVAKTVAHLSNC